MIWNLAENEVLHVLRGHSSNVLGVAFSPNGKQLASVSKDSTVRVWEVDTGRSTAVLQGHGERVYGVQYLPDGKQLATCGRDGSIRIWDATIERYRQSIKPGIDAYRAFGPAGNRIAVQNRAVTIVLDPIGNNDEIIRIVGVNAKDIPAAVTSDAGLAVLATKSAMTIKPRSSRLTSELLTSNRIGAADLDLDGDLDSFSAFGRHGWLVWSERTENGLLAPRLWSDRYTIPHRA